MTAPMSGVGATTFCARSTVLRFDSAASSGTGATTEEGNPGNLLASVVASIGTGTFVCGQETTFGKGTSSASFRSGGTTTVCVWLSASGGTEITSCRE